MIAGLRAELGDLLERPSDVRWYAQDAWEWFHAQTFERVGLTLTTTKWLNRRTRDAIELGQDIARLEHGLPLKPLAKVRHLHVV